METAMMNTRRTEAAVAGFHASPELTENLQKILVDLVELQAEDPSTAGLLDPMIDGLEKQAWLIKAENMKI